MQIKMAVSLQTLWLCSLHNIEYISLHHSLIAHLQMSVIAHNPSVQALSESNSASPQAVMVDGMLPSLVIRYSKNFAVHLTQFLHIPMHC